MKPAPKKSEKKGKAAVESFEETTTPPVKIVKIPDEGRVSEASMKETPVETPAETTPVELPKDVPTEEAAAAPSGVGAPREPMESKAESDVGREDWSEAGNRGGYLKSF